jgi:hypothetical protein
MLASSVSYENTVWDGVLLNARSYVWDGVLRIAVMVVSIIRHSNLEHRDAVN